jgi:predicted phosphodiesterase
MQFAILGAPMGHADALRAALDAIDARGILTILHTGNAAVGGSQPNEAIALLDEYGVQGVQGEQDRLAVLFTRKGDALKKRLDPDLYAALADTRGLIAAARLESLRSLPRSRRIAIDEVTIALCHGTVTNQAGTIDPEAPVDRLRRQREEANADCIVCGKHETPWSRLVDDTLIVCAGVMTADEGRYTIVDTGARPWHVENASARA